LGPIRRQPLSALGAAFLMGLAMGSPNAGVKNQLMVQVARALL